MGKSVKKKKRFSKAVVVAVLVNVFFYVWAHLILSAAVGAEIAPTVSVAFLGFCGCEAGILGWIKKGEEKKEKTDENGFTENNEP